jgi:hypothetical protein
MCVAAASLLFLSQTSRAQAVLEYSESLPLEWGTVQLLEGGIPSREQDTWFARRPPSFSEGDLFALSRRECLLTAFTNNVRMGMVGDEMVFCIDAALSRFRRAIVGEQCVQSVGAGMGFPPRWSQGNPKTINWRFWFRFVPAETATPESRAILNIELLTEAVPQGQAWEISIPAAMENLQVRRYLEPSELDAPSQAALVASTNWARLFLMAPATATATNLPAVATLTDLDPWAIPVSFGVQALRGAVASFTTNPVATTSRRRQFEAWLSPASTNDFAQSANYFPESDISRRELRGVQVRTGRTPSDLVQVFSPPDTNLVIARVGPFHRFEPPRVLLSRVRGQTNVYELEELKTKLKDNPGAYEKYVASMTNLQAGLEQIVHRLSSATNQFFWLPEFKRFHLQIMRELEGHRRSAGAQAEIRTNGLLYHVVFAPSWGEGDLSGSYDPTMGPGIAAGLKFARLWKSSDSLHVRGSVALHAVEGSLGYDVDYYRSLHSQTVLHLNPNAGASYDEKFRLGSLSSAPFQMRELSAGIGHEVRHGAQDWSLKVRDEIFWQAFDLAARQPGISDFSGDGLRFHHQQVWTWWPGRHSASNQTWQLTLSPGVDYAPEAGWTDSFWIVDLALGARVDFGGTEADAMYLSLRGSLGTASDHVPPISLFRLGDFNRLFGLEPGEFSGRSYSHVEASWGIGMDHLLGRLFAQMRDEERRPAILSGAFIALIVEVGTIAASGDFDALHRADSTVSSFGAVLEKRADGLADSLGFRLGYAYSPDSIRTGGRFFTGLVWSF